MFWVLGPVLESLNFHQHFHNRSVLKNTRFLILSGSTDLISKIFIINSHQNHQTSNNGSKSNFFHLNDLQASNNGFGVSVLKNSKLLDAPFHRNRMRFWNFEASIKIYHSKYRNFDPIITFFEQGSKEDYFLTFNLKKSNESQFWDILRL